MRLRNRLALNTLVGGIVWLIIAFVVTDLWRGWLGDRALSRAIEATMASDGRARCEAQPGTFGGRPLEPMPPIVITEPTLKPVPQIFAYGATFQSSNPLAPPFPNDLRTTLLTGRRRSVGTFPAPSGAGIHVAVRMSWTDGPCAIVLARFGAFSLPASTEAFRLAVVLLCLMASALLSAGPIIARIHRLTAAVKTSADSMYATSVPVSGDDEIFELEKAFNRAGEQVKAQVDIIQDREAALRSVVSNTAHDVAVPLTVVQGHLSTLQSLLPTSGPAHEGLRAAIRETHYLAALLHNLGAAARLERPAATIERRPLDLNALVERVVARHNPLAATLEVELGTAGPEERLQVSADVTLLEQAASNLVHNAIHYNKPGGHVAVVLETVENGRRFSLRVIDDGPGIPAGERAQLTDRTFRGDAARARRPEGQGLGLHIVREVVERHGFDLHIGESAYGGAEFEIEGPSTGEALHGGPPMGVA